VKNIFDFLSEMIISYPLIWNNFLENIIKKDYLMVTDEYHIVVYKEKLNKNLLKTYSFIYTILEKNKAILSINENQYFSVATFYNPMFLRIFYDLDYWLFLITRKVLNDLDIKYFENEYLYFDKMSTYLEVVVNREINIILFNDTYNEFIIPNCFIDKKIILVSLKNIKVNNINLIKYNYQYVLFKKRLIELLIFPI